METSEGEDEAEQGAVPTTAIAADAQAAARTVAITVAQGQINIIIYTL